MNEFELWVPASIGLESAKVKKNYKGENYLLTKEKMLKTIPQNSAFIDVYYSFLLFLKKN